MKKIIIIHIVLLCSHFAMAQNAYTDSLTNQLNHPPITITEKMKTYGLLVEQLRTEYLFDKATEKNKELIALAKAENNLTELTKAYVHQGIIYVGQDDYEQGQVYLDLARASSEKATSELATAYSSYLEAYMLNEYQDYESAIKIFQKVLSAIEHTDDEFLKAKTCYFLYAIYTNWNDLDNTLLYADKAVEAARKSGDKNLLSNAYSALAVAYTYKYDIYGDKQDLDRIFEICEKAITLNHQFEGQVAARTYALSKLNIASYYFKYYPEKKQFIKEKILEALEAGKQAPSNQVITANCYGMLSLMAQEENNFLQAENYLNMAYSVLLTENPVYLHTMIKICESLAGLYEKTKQHEKAFQFQKLMTDYTLQLFNQEQAGTAKRLEAQYQFEKKEQEVQMHKERAESQRKQKLLYAGLGIMGLIGTFFIFYSYNFKLKYSLTREKQLEAEKQEAELQVKLEKEEQSRLKAEQELLALQQEKLQNEVMANQLHIQHKNEVLQQLKEKLGDNQSLNINQIIREENLLDNDFEKAKFQIQEIHPNFFKTLNENTLQKLTSLDLKYCAYFYLGMDTKQIANLLNVEPKSVRMTKYRLKKKFGLGEEVDLVGYLKQIGRGH